MNIKAIYQLAILERIISIYYISIFILYYILLLLLETYFIIFKNRIYNHSFCIQTIRISKYKIN